MAIRTFTPPIYLNSIVRRIWHTDFQLPDDYCQSIRILANGSPGLIFQHSDGHSAVQGAGDSLLPISYIYGQGIAPCVNSMRDSAFVCGFEFYPAALKYLFGIDASLLTNSLVELEYLIGRRINDQLLNACDTKSAVNLLCTLLAQHLAGRKSDGFVEESVRLIMKETAAITSATLPSHFNISKRQFQRRFKEHIGVCPETYIRIIRFQKSIHWLQNQHYRKINDISYALGYTDQSYFNREFKFFSGYTPTEFLKTVTTQQPFYQRSERSMVPLRILSY